MNDTIEIPLKPGRHTLQLRNGRNPSQTQTFDAAEGETVAFRCTGKRFLPIFLASFVVPSLALKLKREWPVLGNAHRQVIKTKPSKCQWVSAAGAGRVCRQGRQGFGVR